jgi:uracil-DNA glycosylase family 4
MSTDSPRDAVRQVAEALRWYLQSLKESGVTGVPRDIRRGRSPVETVAPSVPAVVSDAPYSSSASLQIEARKEQLSVSIPPGVMQEMGLPMPTEAENQSGLSSLPAVQTLEALRAEIGDCRRCKLHSGRTTIVFGVGNPQAELMFVGEGPGRDEDLKGEPFVGRAGQLLTEIITKGMKMRREEVYIANVVKCRPPDNRNPEPDEIAACQPFLIKQVELVKPRVIIALGTFAAQTLLKTKTPISRLRGIWHSYHGIKLMPTLHPAYLLRNPNDKRLVWHDIQAVLRDMGRL